MFFVTRADSAARFQSSAVIFSRANLSADANDSFGASAALDELATQHGAHQELRLRIPATKRASFANSRTRSARFVRSLTPTISTLREQVAESLRAFSGGPLRQKP